MYSALGTRMTILFLYRPNVAVQLVNSFPFCEGSVIASIRNIELGDSSSKKLIGSNLKLIV